MRRSFHWLDNRVWFRNYQVVWSPDAKATDEPELAEIGPRFVLMPIRIFAGAFGGKTLYENEDYVSPNELRREQKRAGAQRYLDRAAEKRKTAIKKSNLELPEDEVEAVFHDAAGPDDSS